MSERGAAAAVGEVGALLLGGTGVVLAVGVIGSLAVADRSGPAFALLLAVGLLAALAWPTAWAALLAGRTVPAAVAGVLGVLASLAVPAFYAAGSGSGGDAWRALVMPVLVAGALVAVVVRDGRRRAAPPCSPGRGAALLAGTVLVIAVTVVVERALTRAGSGLDAVVDISSVVLGLVLAAVGLATAPRLGPARARAVGLLLLAGPGVSQAALAVSGGAGTATTVVRWAVLVVLLGLVGGFAARAHFLRP